MCPRCSELRRPHQDGRVVERRAREVDVAVVRGCDAEQAREHRRAARPCRRGRCRPAPASRPWGDRWCPTCSAWPRRRCGPRARRRAGRRAARRRAGSRRPSRRRSGRRPGTRPRRPPWWRRRRSARGPTNTLASLSATMYAISGPTRWWLIGVMYSADLQGRRGTARSARRRSAAARRPCRPRSSPSARRPWATWLAPAEQVAGACAPRRRVDERHALRIRLGQPPEPEICHGGRLVARELRNVVGHPFRFDALRRTVRSRSVSRTHPTSGDAHARCECLPGNTGDDKLEIVDDMRSCDPGPGEVTVKIEATGVCHSDLSGMNGTHPAAGRRACSGHEGAGERHRGRRGRHDTSPWATT